MPLILVTTQCMSFDIYDPSFVSDRAISSTKPYVAFVSFCNGVRDDSAASYWDASLRAATGYCASAHIGTDR